MKRLNIIHYIVSIPKTIYFNFKYLPIKQAIKLPIFVSNRVFLDKVRGKVVINSDIKTGMIKIGFNRPGLFDYKRQRSVWSVEGRIEFRGEAIIGSGSRICTDIPQGNIIFGKNFTITANTQIWSRKK